jgi:hypothetical protein
LIFSSPVAVVRPFHELCINCRLHTKVTTYWVATCMNKCRCDIITKALERVCTPIVYSTFDYLLKWKDHAWPSTTLTDTGFPASYPNHRLYLINTCQQLISYKIRIDKEGCSISEQPLKSCNAAWPPVEASQNGPLRLSAQRPPLPAVGQAFSRTLQPVIPAETGRV